MTVRYKLGCDLSYEVKSPTTFIFNFEVARLVRHIDLVEQLAITPDSPSRTYIVEPGPVLITIEHADGSTEAPGRTIDAISTEEPAPNAGAL